MTKKYTKQRNAGFTMIETLIVLKVILIILLLIGPISKKQYDHFKEKQFFKVFSYDLLYTQQLAMSHRNENVRIRIYPNQNEYALLKGQQQNTVLFRKKLPDGWSFISRGLRHIGFNEKGTVREAGRIEIHTHNHVYQLVLPPGEKGRGYVIQQ